VRDVVVVQAIGRGVCSCEIATLRDCERLRGGLRDQAIGTGTIDETRACKGSWREQDCGSRRQLDRYSIGRGGWSR